MLQRHAPLILVLIFFLLFLGGTVSSSWKPERTDTPEGQVVIAAPIQLVLFAGDRYLAANLEAIRAATITLDDLNDRQRATYRLRSHEVVGQLNPCHEDNYYLGNAVLTWGGLEDAGSDLLQRATECRFWDEVPPFFYGFNEYFFHRNTEEAREALETAAKRADKNRAALRKLAIMITAEDLDDETMALNYLRSEQENTEDPKLKAMLEKRVKRLQGLITLREAQREYEKRFQQPLQHPEKLLERGILPEFPRDPLKLGYKFSDGKFQLNTMKIRGLENRQ